MNFVVQVPYRTKICQKQYASRSIAEEDLIALRDLAILADDLTGTLGTAAAFASVDRPVEAGWLGVSG